MPSAKSSIVILACLLLALLCPTSALALDFTLKGKIQSELDANPFLKEQQINLQVLREESGYVTIEMTEGNGEVRQAINQGIDVLGAELQNRWLFIGGSEDERKTVNALKKSLDYIKKMEGVKEIQLTATVNTRQDQAEKLLEQGEKAESAKDFQRAAQLYGKAVELGSMRAMYWLGQLYMKGQGVPKDEAKGMAFIRRAAELGDSHSQYELGRMSYFGQGLPEDKKEAAIWLQKAAELGDLDAPFLLGCIYEDGEGDLPQDQQQADAWFAKAVAYYTLVAKQGDASAKCKVGSIYAFSKGVLSDCGEAISWLEQCKENWTDWALAWIYATCKEPKHRDGSKAVQHALSAERKQPNDWQFQDTLAAAYARDSQFTKAVATQQKAIFLLQENKMDKEKESKKLKELNERLALYQNGQPYTDLGQQTEHDSKLPAPNEPASQEAKPPTSKAPEPARQEQGGQAGEQPQPGSGPAQTTVERIKAFARKITHPREEPPKPQAAVPPAPKTQEPAQQEQGSLPEKKQQEERELAIKRQQEKMEEKRQQERRELEKKIEEQKQFAERREALRKDDAREKTAELARLDQIRAGANARAAAAEAARLQSGATSTTRGRESAKPIAESTYEGTVVQRVRTNWKKPEGASWDASLQAQVFITVNRNGEVVDIRFSQKSRDNRFDELAEKTIRTAAPMPPFPAVMQKETTVIGLRFKAGEFGVH